MQVKLQPLSDLNDLPDDKLFIVEVKPKEFARLAPFYGIVRLLATQPTNESELFDADGNGTGYLIADITGWAPFEVEES